MAEAFVDSKSFGVVAGAGIEVGEGAQDLRVSGKPPGHLFKKFEFLHVCVA
jgi:hypothetical protein